MRRLLTFLAVLLAVLASSTAAASVRVWLDRDEVALGETVTLNIEVQGAGIAAPDFSPLDADFQRRGSSSSSQIALRNGQRSATTLFAVSLQPRREGELQVPSLQVAGVRTDPLPLKVAPSPIATGSGGDVFLEATASARGVYVQQQVVYALKLFYAVSLWDGQLDPPSLDGVQVHRLGDDLKYQVERSGRRYSVIERRFALVPERSGEFRLPAPRFEGTGTDRGGYGGLLGSAGVRLSASGEPLTLTVRPRPPGATDPWLPASALSLDLIGEALPEQVRVGEPLSLGVQLSARGLLPAQLPELDLPAIDGAAVYPDQTSSRDRSSAEGLASERFRRFAIVPQRAGKLQLPGLRIGWWDVQSDRLRWAELAPHSIEVLPAADVSTARNGERSGAAASEQALDALDAAGGLAPGAGRDTGGQAPVLFAWTVGAGLLGLLLGWALGRRRAPSSATLLSAAPPASAPPTAVELTGALRRGDLAAIAASLRAAAPEPLRWAETLYDPEQRDAATALLRQLYAPAPGPVDPLLASLRKAFAHGPRWRSQEIHHAQRKERYPPLYG